jgi:hypothetical protein
VYTCLVRFDLLCGVFCVFTQLRWLSILLRSVSRFRQFLNHKEVEIWFDNILVCLVRMNVVTTMGPQDTSELPSLTWRTLSGLKGGRSLFAGRPQTTLNISSPSFRSLEARAESRSVARWRSSPAARVQSFVVRKKGSRRVWASVGF